MIFVDRQRVAPSEKWLQRAVRETAKAAAAGRAGEADPGLDLRRAWASRETRELLIELFRAKCAFCETCVGVTGSADIEHFRPRTRAVDLDGEVFAGGYWWLAAAWGNLYFSCQICNRNKANRFPVAGRRAAAPDGDLSELLRDPLTGRRLAGERALVLDPCHDNPQQYLVFDENGWAASLPQDEATLQAYGGHDRGRVTIDIFGLNRKELVEQRRLVATSLWERYKTLLDLVAGRSNVALLRERIEALFEERPEMEYLALRRQILSEIREGLEVTLSTARLDDVLREPTRGGGLRGRSLGTPEIEEPASRHFDAVLGQSFSVGEGGLGGVSKAVKSSAIHDQQVYQRRVEQGSIDDLSTYGRSAAIASIRVHNFRGLADVELRFGGGAEGQASWMALLGENGVGKSSVLHAVALTLMGQRHLDSVAADVDFGGLLRRGTDEGLVQVQLAADADALEMRVGPEGVSFADSKRELRTFLFGFGSARWLPRRGSLPPDERRLFRVQNLFNPFVPLSNAVGWLASLSPDEVAFRRAEEPILKLLQRPPGDRLGQRDGRVVILPGRDGGKALPLAELSDGYQTILAIAGEILQVTGAVWENPADAEGIVLLDEIGAHLHPRWKLRVVGSFRQAFPRLQFLVTTHEPLCLRGLHDREIVLMRFDDQERLEVVGDLPSIEGMRIDQILTSHLFGLGSTLDPQVEKDFNTYYALLAKKRRTAEEEELLAALRETVGSQGVLGDTPREQMIYRVIDEYLAREPPRPGESPALERETVQRAAELWKQSAVKPPPPE
jgi:AAA domain, putative AbiEii toxin, Type IV TA system